jgi:type IV secretion system protein VirD4
MQKVVLALVGSFTVLLGYPCAAAVQHGLDPALWPAVVLTPAQWVAGLTYSYAIPNLAALLEMAESQSVAFAGGGLSQLMAIASVPIAFLMMFPSSKGGPRKDPDAPHGAARWANRGERATMKRGVEFGVDIETGRPIRVALEGNIVTIAPPRAGKTSGLIVPNSLMS